MIGFEQVGRWIADLRAAVDDLPTHRWGTITQTDPVRVLLDGPNESPLPYSPAHLGHLRTGDRVLVLGLLGHHVILGAKGGTGQPWATASGAVSVPVSGSPRQGTLEVAFPAGRFPVAPVVQLTPRQAYWHAAAVSSSATGFTIHISDAAGSSSATSVSIGWTAFQMTPTGAGG